MEQEGSSDFPCGKRKAEGEQGVGYLLTFKYVAVCGGYMALGSRAQRHLQTVDGNLLQVLDILKHVWLDAEHWRGLQKFFHFWMWYYVMSMTATSPSTAGSLQPQMDSC